MTAHDLDALLSELDDQGATVTLFGEEWTLPPDVDAETMLRVQRLQMKLALAKKTGKPVREDDVIDDAITVDQLVEKMAGPDNFAEWQRRGLTYRALLLIAGRLYAIHAGEDEAGKGSNGRAKRTRKNTGSRR